MAFDGEAPRAGVSGEFRLARHPSCEKRAEEGIALRTLVWVRESYWLKAPAELKDSALS